MKLKGLVVLFFALTFWLDSGAAVKKDPVIYSPFENLFNWYQPLLQRTPGLAEGNEDFSEQKISDLFNELQSDLHLVLNDAVFDFIKHYITGQKKNFEVALSLETLYGSQILEEVIERDLPRELALLPLSLSGMHNQAVSTAGGCGLWDLNYYLAIKKGLKVTHYVDERKDPEKSTAVALNYLQELYDQYKSWNLAITAFATSPTLVNNAILASGNKTNYWDIQPYLSTAARNIIPSFFASVFVASYYPELDLNLPGILINRNKELLNIESEVSMSVLAKELEISEQSLRLLNPTFRGTIIPPTGNSGIDFYVPQGFTVRITKVEKDLYSETRKINQPKKVVPKKSPLPIPEGTVKVFYVVQSGDYLGKIAENHHVRLSHLKKWNGMRSDRINIGQKLVLYVRPGVLKPVRKTSAKASIVKIPSSKLMDYVVKDGDSLWSIAKGNPGNSIETIQGVNGIGTDIRPGQVIKIIKP